MLTLQGLSSLILPCCAVSCFVLVGTLLASAWYLISRFLLHLPYHLDLWKAGSSQFTVCVTERSLHTGKRFGNILIDFCVDAFSSLILLSVGSDLYSWIIFWFVEILGNCWMKQWDGKYYCSSQCSLSVPCMGRSAILYPRKCPKVHWSATLHKI